MCRSTKKDSNVCERNENKFNFIMCIIDKIKEIKKRRSTIDIQFGLNSIRAKYTREMAMELKDYHGLDVSSKIENELAQELSKELSKYLK